MKSGHWFAGSVGAACLVWAICSCDEHAPSHRAEQRRDAAQLRQSPVQRGRCMARRLHRPASSAASGGNGRVVRGLSHADRQPSSCPRRPPGARFEAPAVATGRGTPNADDPLFRPIDADDFRENGEQASDFSNLVDNGLVRVTMPLPANVVLIDPSTGQPSSETSVDLWRAVIPVFNVAITGPDGQLPVWPPGAPRVPIMGQDPNGPNRQGGYQHDARFGTLQEQARAALIHHAEVTVEPPADMLDDLAAFQQTLFSSSGVKRLADAMALGRRLHRS